MFQCDLIAKKKKNGVWVGVCVFCTFGHVTRPWSGSQRHSQGRWTAGGSCRPARRTPHLRLHPSAGTDRHDWGAWTAERRQTQIMSFKTSFNRHVYKITQRPNQCLSSVRINNPGDCPRAAALRLTEQTNSINLVTKLFHLEQQV